MKQRAKKKKKKKSDEGLLSLGTAWQSTSLASRLPRVIGDRPVYNYATVREYAKKKKSQ